MAVASYNFTNRRPPVLLEVLGVLIGVGNEPISKADIIRTCIRPKAKAEWSRVTEQRLSCYFRFLTTEGMVIRASERKMFFVDVERCKAVIDAMGSRQTILPRTDEARRLEIIEKAWRDSRIEIVIMPLETSVPSMPIHVVASASKVAAEVVPTAEPEPASVDDKPTKPTVYTSVAYFTRVEQHLHIAFAAVSRQVAVDARYQRVSVCPDKDADGIPDSAIKIWEVADQVSCDQQHVCDAIRRFVNHSHLGIVEGVGRGGCTIFNILYDPFEVDDRLIGDERPTDLPFLAGFEHERSADIENDDKWSTPSRSTVAGPTTYVAIHKVIFRPEEAAALLRMHYGEAVRATHVPVVATLGGEFVEWFTTTDSDCVNGLLGRSSFKELSLVFPTNDCTGYKIRPAVARVCCFVRRQEGSHASMVTPIRQRSRQTFDKPDHWIAALKEIAGSLFVEPVRPTHDVSEVVTPVSEEISGAVVAETAEEVNASQPEPQTGTRFIGFVYPSEAKVLLLVDGQRQRIGIDAVNGRLVRALKEANLIRNSGGRNQCALFEFLPGADEWLEFRRCEAEGVCFGKTLDALPRNGEWRSELEVIAGCTTAQVVAEFEKKHAAKMARREAKRATHQLHKACEVKEAVTKKDEGLTIVDTFFVTPDHAKRLIAVAGNDGTKYRIGFGHLPVNLRQKLIDLGYIENRGGRHGSSIYVLNKIKADGSLAFLPAVPRKPCHRFESNTPRRNGEWCSELEAIAALVVSEVPEVEVTEPVVPTPAESIEDEPVVALSPEPQAQARHFEGVEILVGSESDADRVEPEDLTQMSDERLMAYDRLLAEIAESIKAKRAKIAVELAEREERRRVEAEKARRRTEIEEQLVVQRAAAEEARRQAAEAAAAMASLEAELAAL